MNKYYSLAEEDDVLECYIYGNIASWSWNNSHVSSKSFADQIRDSKASQIVVKINSYGGEVSEALAIYNELREKSKKGVTVTTMNMGFACSAASLVFCAGDKRLMSKNSLLMVHNPWSSASGDADDFRKEAETLDKITDAVKAVYKDVSNIDDNTLKELLDNETWISASDAIAYGLATSENLDDDEQTGAVAKVKNLLFNMILEPKQESKPKPPKPSPKPLNNFEKIFKNFKGE